MTEVASFAVVIATYDRRETLSRTLDSLKACRIPDSFSRLIIVENGSRECQEVVQTLPACFRAVHLHSPVANKSAALNLAMENLHEDFVLFFDDDIRIDPLVLKAYASAFRRHDQRFFYRGKCTAEFDSAPDERVLRFFPKSVRGLDYGESEQTEKDQYMTYVRGSHQVFHPYGRFLKNGLYFDYCRQYLENIEVLKATGAAGDMFMFDSNGMHSANRSESARRDIFLLEFSADKFNIWGGDLPEATPRTEVCSVLDRFLAVTPKWNRMRGEIRRKATSWAISLEEPSLWV